MGGTGSAICQTKWPGLAAITSTRSASVTASVTSWVIISTARPRLRCSCISN